MKNTLWPEVICSSSMVSYVAFRLLFFPSCCIFVCDFVQLIPPPPSILILLGHARSFRALFRAAVAHDRAGCIRSHGPLRGGLLRVPPFGGLFERRAVGPLHHHYPPLGGVLHGVLPVGCRSCLDVSGWSLHCAEFSGPRHWWHQALRFCKLRTRVAIEGGIRVCPIFVPSCNCKFMVL